VNFVLDASVTLGWHLTRPNPNEALLAQEALHGTMIHGALVPYLWYPEVANALVIAERQQLVAKSGPGQWRQRHHHEQRHLHRY